VGVENNNFGDYKGGQATSLLVGTVRAPLPSR